MGLSPHRGVPLQRHLLLSDRRTLLCGPLGRGLVIGSVAVALISCDRARDRDDAREAPAAASSSTTSSTTAPKNQAATKYSGYEYDDSPGGVEDGGEIAPGVRTYDGISHDSQSGKSLLIHLVSAEGRVMIWLEQFVSGNGEEGGRVKVLDAHDVGPFNPADNLGLDYKLGDACGPPDHEGQPSRVLGDTVAFVRYPQDSDYSQDLSHAFRVVADGERLEPIPTAGLVCSRVADGV